MVLTTVVYLIARDWSHHRQASVFGDFLELEIEISGRGQAKPKVRLYKSPSKRPPSYSHLVTGFIKSTLY